MEDAEFSHWLELPAGTAFVEFSDLPHLIACALHRAPGGDEFSDIRYGAARINLEGELPRAVESGELKVRDPLTYGPHQFPHGNALQCAVVKVSDLCAYVAERGIGVRVASPVPTPSDLGRVDGESGGHQGKSATTYKLPMFARLVPTTTDFEGGRLADSDPPLELDEAAGMASRHAGRSVNVADFLRAGARGEILLFARVPRSTTLMPTREADVEAVPVVPGSFLPLPSDAVQALAVTGVTEWRSLQGMEPCDEMGGVQAFFDRWRLQDGEPSFQAGLSNVRVSARDVHALADAFRAQHDGPPTAPQSVLSATEPTHSDGRTLTTPELADAFDGIDDVSAEQWRRRLGDLKNHAWLMPARANAGRAPRPSTWLPLRFAELLMERDVAFETLNRKFLTVPKLKPWLPAWQEARRDRNAFGL